MSADKDPNLILEVFNQRAGILTFFGMLGGSVRAAVLKTTWREGVRVVFVGGAVAFGVGVLGPVLMKPWIGDLPDEMAGAMGTLTAASFLIGLVAVTLVERFIAGEANDATSPTTRQYGPKGGIDPSVDEAPMEENPNAEQG